VTWPGGAAAFGEAGGERPTADSLQWTPLPCLPVLGGGGVTNPRSGRRRPSEAPAVIGGDVPRAGSYDSVPRTPRPPSIFHTILPPGRCTVLVLRHCAALHCNPILDNPRVLPIVSQIDSPSRSPSIAPTPPAIANMQVPLIRLSCGVNSYEWGKKGNDSAAARFAAATPSDTLTIQADKPYAEVCEALSPFAV